MRIGTLGGNLCKKISICGFAALHLFLPLAFAEDAPRQAPHRTRVGELSTLELSTQHPYPGSDRTFEVHRPGATYIKVHFARFDLAPGDRLVVSSPDGRERYVFAGKGYKQKGENFWVNSVLGDRAILQLQSVSGGAYGFDVDYFAYGTEPLLPPAPDSVCGNNDWQDAACFENSFPTEYQRAKSAVVVLYNGVENCTGVKVGCPNQFLTNEHCVSNQAQVDATEVRFEYQRTECGSGGSSFSQSHLGDQFITDGFTLDYCLFTAFGESVGYEAAELDPRLPPVGERIYITGHPAGSPKQLSIVDTSNGTGLCRVDFSPTDGRGTDSDIGYFCDTTGGSSGSPVWSGVTHKLVGLHHLGGCPNSAGRIDLIFDNIGSLIASCCETEPNVPTLSAQAAGPNRIDLLWDDSALPTVAGYELKRSRIDGGPYETIATVADTSPGAGSGAGYTHSDTDVSGGTTYYYVVQSTDGDQCTSDASAQIDASASGACTLPPIFGGIATLTSPQQQTCSLEVGWSAAVPECGSSVTYNVYRSPQPDFVPGAGNLVASGLTGTAFLDVDQLVHGSVYSYRVRAVDTANLSEETNDSVQSFSPIGPGAGACTTGSSCPDNPFVDVSPDGPMTVCEGGGPELTALLNGGTGPFQYQWIRDGQPIPGATDSSYTPTELGTHGYNVLVAADGCPNQVFDGLDTQLLRVNQPFFNGIVGANDPQTESECTVDLGWDSATTACDGPVHYYVYRDTLSPVSFTPDRLIAAGLTGTSFADTSGLVNLTEYHYAVRARDVSTGRFDGNTVQRSVTPAGPGNGFLAVFAENFDNPANFANWTVTTGPGSHNCGAWTLSNASGTAPSNSTGNYAWADGTCGGQLLPLTSTTVESPSVDLDIADALSMTLEVDLRYATADGDNASVQVWNGSQWITVWTDPNAAFNQHLSIDVMQQASGNSDFRFRFDYQNANADRFFSFDNVQIVVERQVSCSTAPPGPPSIPAGSLIVDRSTTLDAMTLVWDTTACVASDYSLLYGDLAQVETATLAGSVCALGATGSHTWTGVPAGNLFYLIVGSDGSSTESSWGRSDAFVERGSGASGECGAASRDTSSSCQP